MSCRMVGQPFVYPGFLGYLFQQYVRIGEGTHLEHFPARPGKGRVLILLHYAQGNIG